MKKIVMIFTMSMFSCYQAQAWAFIKPLEYIVKPFEYIMKTFQENKGDFKSPALLDAMTEDELQKLYEDRLKDLCITAGISAATAYLAVKTMGIFGFGASGVVWQGSKLVSAAQPTIVRHLINACGMVGTTVVSVTGGVHAGRSLSAQLLQVGEIRAALERARSGHFARGPRVSVPNDLHALKALLEQARDDHGQLKAQLEAEFAAVKARQEAAHAAQMENLQAVTSDVRAIKEKLANLDAKVDGLDTKLNTLIAAFRLAVQSQGNGRLAAPVQQIIAQPRPHARPHLLN